MKTLDIVTYNTIDNLVEEIVNTVVDTDKYIITTVVADADLAKELMRRLFMIEYEPFDPMVIDYAYEDYDKEYYLTITSDLELYCEPAYVSNENGEGYLPSNADYTYIQDCSSQKIVEKLGIGWKVIVDVKELETIKN